MNSLLIFLFCFSKIHSDIDFPSMPSSSKWFLPFRFPDQNFVCIFHGSLACYISCPSHFLDLFPLIIFGEEYKLWSSILYNFLQPPIAFSLLGQYVLSKVRDQFSHSCKTGGKIIVLYVLIRFFLERRHERRFQTEV